jgi:hypothetical protein
METVGLRALQTLNSVCYGTLAEWLRRRSHKAEDVGSIPTRTTTKSGRSSWRARGLISP